MALHRRFRPVFKKYAPRGTARFAKPLQGPFSLVAKHPQKHKNRPEIGRFSHFNPGAEMHLFSLFSASKSPEKWLYDAICRKKQLFAGSFGSRSHSSCSFTVNTLAQIQLVLNTSLVNRLCIFELFGGLASCGLFLLFEISTLLLFSKSISKPAILRYQRKHLALPIQKQQRWHITPALLVLFNTVTETMRLTAVPPPTSCSPSAGVGRFFLENPRLHAPRSPRPSAPLSSLQASS